MREQKMAERARAKTKEERRAAHHAAQSGRPEPRPVVNRVDQARGPAAVTPPAPRGEGRNRNRGRRNRWPGGRGQ
jgi:hypothetical protein